MLKPSSALWLQSLPMLGRHFYSYGLEMHLLSR